MWHKEYKNYPLDTSLIHQKVEPGKGIIGCEMHELNGWGNTLHISSPRPSLFRRWMNILLGSKSSKKHGQR